MSLTSALFLAAAALVVGYLIGRDEGAAEARRGLPWREDDGPDDE